MMTRVTQMMTAGHDLDERQKTLLRGLMIEEMRGLCPTEPGVLKAVSLVAVGLKWLTTYHVLCILWLLFNYLNIDRFSVPPFYKPI
jgi:hypothetical protein